MPLPREPFTPSVSAAPYIPSTSTTYSSNATLAVNTFVRNWGHLIRTVLTSQSVDKKTILLDMIKEMKEFVIQNEKVWHLRPNSSADIRQIIHSIGQISEEPGLFLEADREVINHHMQWVIKWTLSLDKYLPNSVKPFQEISNTLYGIGRLVHAGWLTTVSDDLKPKIIVLMNLFLTKLNEGRSAPGGAAQSIQVRPIPERITQNISSIFYAFHLMKNADILPKNENYSFVQRLMYAFKFFIEQPGNNEPSQDIRFIVQGITAIAQLSLLPRNSDCCKLAFQFARFLLNMPENTSLHAQHLESVLVSLNELIELNLHSATPDDFVLLLSLAHKCLSCMTNNVYLQRGRQEILTSIYKASQQGWLVEDDKSQLEELMISPYSLSKNDLFQVLHQFIQNSIVRISTFSQPQIIPQSSRAVYRQPLFAPPVVLNVPRVPGPFNLLEWEKNVLATKESFRYSTNIQEPSQLIGEAFAFLTENAKTWGRQQSQLGDLRILIYGLGLLSQYPSKNQKSYGRELQVLSNCLSATIKKSEDLPSPPETFWNDIQILCLGLRFMFNSNFFLQNDITLLDLTLIPSLIQQLVCSLKTIPEKENMKSNCIVSIIQSVGLMVEKQHVRPEAIYNCLAELITLLCTSSLLADIQVAELKRSFHILLAIFKHSCLEQENTHCEIILKMLLIPFEMNCFKLHEDKKRPLLGELGPEIRNHIACLLTIAPTDELRTIDVILNLFDFTQSALHAQLREVPTESITLIYQRIHDLLKKQLSDRQVLQKPYWYIEINGVPTLLVVEKNANDGDDDDDDDDEIIITPKTQLFFNHNMGPSSARSVHFNNAIAGGSVDEVTRSSCEQGQW